MTPIAPMPVLRKRPERGFILITVLAIVVLLVATVVAFLLRAASERVSSSGYSASVSARQLGDTAVNLVQGQIQLATTQGIGVAWASQPGMIRTFDQTGNLLEAYKLYSTSAMISSSAGITGGKADDAPPAAWAASPALWTDLNAPVQTSSGTEVYPILDPGATAAGYAVAGAPGATASQPVPMAVRWLYVLQDGTLVAPTGSANAATVAGEAASNKIVGRVAFWADDETCKVNINTAGAGTFWDVPRAYTQYSTTINGVKVDGPVTSGSLTEEQAFGYYQPSQKEFQRFPGHPATTDLRAVFPALNPDQVYSLTPRLLSGGSKQGTVQVASGTSATAAFPGFPKADRLYASLDELLFKPDRTVNPVLTEAQLQQSRFFLTAHSRAPETNLYNLPRIACWPVNADLASNPTSPYTTAFDRLIAFCSSIGAAPNALPYYFQRSDSLSATKDIGIVRNGQLYAYLQYLTGLSAPGFPNGTFAAKYGGDRDQILTEIFDYIRCVDLYDTDPSLGSATAGGEHQFTTVANGNVGSVVPTVNGATLGFGRSLTLTSLALGFICNADGAAGTPTAPVGSTTDPTALAQRESNQPDLAKPKPNLALNGLALGTSQRSIQAILIPQFFSVACGFIGFTPNMTVTVSGLDNLSVTTAGVKQFLFPAAANTSVTYANNSPMQFNTGPGADRYGGNPSWRFFAVSTKKPVPANALARLRASPARGGLPADVSIPASDDPYPFIGNPVTVDTSAGTMAFDSGGKPVVVTISDASGTVVQTFNVQFESDPFPIPKLVDTGTTAGTPTSMEAWWAFAKGGVQAVVPVVAGRLSHFNEPMGTLAVPQSGAFFRQGYDVVRTMVVPHGDFRLVAGTRVVPTTTFQPSANYRTPTQMMAGDLGNPSNTSNEPAYTGGKYLSGLTWPGGHQPDIDPSVLASQTPQATGDFDDPLPDYFPGPYINKPNEGSALNPLSGFTSIPYYASVFQTTAAAQGVDQQNDQGAFFSPNRMMPSPVMFGSLPSGVVAGKPWQTLLFRPQANHPGAATPSDHLLLDLFWMPVVEPYAISDRFSTAGKINMNYQIVPFTYITRSTGMRAVLAPEMVTAMPGTQAVLTSYKDPVNGTKTVFRLAIDADKTLSQFDARFLAGDIFRSASEICTEEIVPTGQTPAGMPAFWATNILTGDNVRERVYASLYPRLTTKSNTFTVHFQAQSLKKVLGSAPGTWTEGKDLVTGEYRGSTTLERFIDANDTALPDYASDTSKISSQGTLDKYYRWRVVANRQFAP